MTNKEKFLNLVAGENTATQEKNDWLIANRKWLREAQKVALKILDRLDELHWTQKMLAEKMNVSPQQVSKIVKGKENLTLDTLSKLQDALDIKLLATFENQDTINILSSRYYSTKEPVSKTGDTSTNYQLKGPSALVIIKSTPSSQEYSRAS